MRKRARRISRIFEKKGERRTYQGWYRAIVIARDKASPSFRRDCDRGALQDWDLLFIISNIGDLLFIVSNVCDTK
jgi:hypothetical protein